MSQRYSGSLSRPDINLTPLIDVLLVLLIIFMVISPVPPRLFETKTPSIPPSVEKGDSSRALIVSMAAGTLELSLNGQPMQVDELASQLASELKRRPANLRTVFIRAPKRALYREVVRIVDLAKGAGADPTGLLIDYLED
jgi:biopolymer transport protein ExbD